MKVFLVNLFRICIILKITKGFQSHLIHVHHVDVATTVLLRPISAPTTSYQLRFVTSDYCRQSTLATTTPNVQF